MGIAAQHRRSGQAPSSFVHPIADATAPRVPSRAPNVAIGLGNDIAADDGAGLAAARLLEAELADQDDIDVVALPWAGFALLDALRGRNRAAIIDCLVSGLRPPGTIVPIGEDDLAGSVRLNSFHDLSYPTALALGREMGWQMPTAIAIWGIEASSADVFSDSLSPPVAAAVQRVVPEVLAFFATPSGRLRRSVDDTQAHKDQSRYSARE